MPLETQVQHFMYLHIHVPKLLSEFIPLCSTKTWLSVQNCITLIGGRHQFSRRKQILMFHCYWKSLYYTFRLLCQITTSWKLHGNLWTNMPSSFLQCKFWFPILTSGRSHKWHRILCCCCCFQSFVFEFKFILFSITGNSVWNLSAFHKTVLEIMYQGHWKLASICICVLIQNRYCVFMSCSCKSLCLLSLQWLESDSWSICISNFRNIYKLQRLRVICAVTPKPWLLALTIF